MGYKQALEKAWNDISELTKEKSLPIKFLFDQYKIKLGNKKVILLSCDSPVKDFVTILILHYLTKKLKLKDLPAPAGEWISFKEIDGGDFYYPVFKKRAINVIFKKFGSNPDALAVSARRFNAKSSEIGDKGIIIEPFEKIPILITIWKGDDELPGEADILFDRDIPQIFCTEDIVVLTETLVHLL